MPKERIVAIGLLTEGDLDQLGTAFIRLWPVEDAPCFIELLRAIDDADAEFERSRAAAGAVARPKGA